MSAHASPAAAMQQTGFTQVPNTILKANLSLGARMLYSILLSYCYHKDYCYPSYETLMKDLHCHSQALRKYITELIKHGLITVERHEQGSTNRYILTQRVTTDRATAEPAQENTPEQRSLKIKEQPLRKSKTEEYISETYEDGYPSNVRKANREASDYVNSAASAAFTDIQTPPAEKRGEGPHNTPAAASEHTATAGKAADHRSQATNRNLETIERETISPAPADTHTMPSMHVPYAARTTSEETAIQTVIQGYIRDAAYKLHDEAPLKSSTTRAYNLYLRSGMQLNTFFDTLYDAEQETIRRSATIRKLTARGFKNKMAYFFAIVEDKLGLRQTIPIHSPQSP